MKLSTIVTPLLIKTPPPAIKPNVAFEGKCGIASKEWLFLTRIGQDCQNLAEAALVLHYSNQSEN
jgi:hypothetical protein